MHKRFEHKEFEKKWQDKWASEGLYDVGERDESKEKEYVLVEWPYPSGNLHIGHWYAFAVPDIYVRYKRMLGKQVLYPMGFDAFGLPAENAAIKRNLDPKEWTNSNIDYMRQQLASMGNSFAWDKTCNSTDPEYYKWTQWMFTQFFENDIAYRGEGTVNWCPGCNTVIANEQVLADGTCERSGDEIEKKRMPQWMLRITDFADELIDDLDGLDWPEFIKESQRNWIGRSKGAELEFALRGITDQADDKHMVKVFTTRPDTLYGVTFLAISPELAKTWIEFGWKASDDVQHFVATELKTRANKTKDFKEDTDKRGVDAGITAVNPVNGEEVPVWIVNYVLGDVGTGAVMAVPGHDERDNEFAKKFNLPIRQVIAPIYHGEGADAPRDDVGMNPNRDCVDLIIEHPTDGTFLLQREKDGDRDLVHFVGGGNDGEDDKIAVARELEEETGYSNFEFVSEEPILRTHSIGYRHSKKINQQGISGFYHIKLKDLDQKPSEIEEGKHTVEWVSREDVEKLITWKWHARAWDALNNDTVITELGTIVHSEEFDGMDSQEAKAAITEKAGGKLTNTYRLRDWSIGRQRYWGVPIPIVYDPEGNAHPVPKEHLPWLLPEDVDFRPTGEAPLAKSAELKKRTEEIFGEGWTPEVETMDTFVDSSWYFLRYLDNKNDEELASEASQQSWMPIDVYFGGAEHTTMHLLYSRFWMKALKKLGLTNVNEPYKKRINRSIILGTDGNKMSKSKGNVVDPDEQVERVGSDTVKMYLSFMGPYAEVNHYPFDLGGIAGIRRFLERVNGLTEHLTDTEPESTSRLFHKTIKKVTSDITEFKFNTAISAMMIFVNHVEKEGLSKDTYEGFLKLLAPFAPHLTEELWSTDHDSSIHSEDYPEFNAELAKDDAVTIGVQINGKLRGDITISPEATEEDALNAAKENGTITERLEGADIAKVIYVPGRILNLIVKN